MLNLNLIGTWANGALLGSCRPELAQQVAQPNTNIVEKVEIKMFLDFIIWASSSTSQSASDKKEQSTS